MKPYQVLTATILPTTLNMGAAKLLNYILDPSYDAVAAGGNKAPISLLNMEEADMELCDSE